MSIKSDVDELQRINSEIRRTAETLKKLREAKKDVEARIAEFLKEKDLPGVKYNQNVIVLKQNSTTRTQPKKFRNVQVLDLLAQSGVEDPHSLLQRRNAVGKEKVTRETISIDRRV